MNVLVTIFQLWCCRTLVEKSSSVVAVVVVAAVVVVVVVVDDVAVVVVDVAISDSANGAGGPLDKKLCTASYGSSGK